MESVHLFRWSPLTGLKLNEKNLLFYFYFSIHLNWLPNKNWHVAVTRARTNEKCIKMRSSRSHCAWRTFEKRWHKNSTSGSVWRTHSATQQRQYRVCDAKIVHSSLCDALYHHQNGIEIQLWWKIICRFFFYSSFCPIAAAFTRSGMRWQKCRQMRYITFPTQALP